MKTEDKNLLERAKEVLEYNDLGGWTRPAPDLYPHQWLWDSCFIAIGWSHLDTKRACDEIRSLFRGQWSNGMLPHMIFSNEKTRSSPEFWNSRISPYAPSDVATSGITQPPLVAEAVIRIGQRLKKAEREEFYKEILPSLIKYHEWLYRERDPHHEGLVLLIHPWENGLDNSPTWVEAMRIHAMPTWIKLVETLRIDVLIEKFRSDTRQVSPDERMTTIESLMFYHVARRLRRKHYDTERILNRSHFLVDDLFFNCMLVRANQRLKEIAKEVNEPLPRPLLSTINKASKCLESLWDEEAGRYFSRLFVTRRTLDEPTIAGLMPLYAGTITKKRAERLVELLYDEHQYGVRYPAPSVPISSSYFNHRRYWQGPTWINTNWLLIDGLKRYGFHDEAERIRKISLELVEKSGFHEYFSPIDGFGAGIQPFSWTAALTIDLLENKK